jgi:hypothetical protein
MNRSIATVSLSGTLEEKLQAAAAARFDALEIVESDFICCDGSARQVRALAADLGLKIALYQPFRDFEGVSDEQFRRNLDRAERKFDVMQELGAPRRRGQRPSTACARCFFSRSRSAPGCAMTIARQLAAGSRPGPRIASNSLIRRRNRRSTDCRSSNSR